MVQPLVGKLIQDPQTQIVVSPSGEPSYLQVPWKVVMALTEGELETLEILSNSWWRQELIKRLAALEENPSEFLKNAVSLEEYRGKKK